MFLGVTKQRNGQINLFIRDPVTKKTKHKVLEALGFVDEYLDRYEDPVMHFKKVVRERNLPLKEEKAAKETSLGFVSLDENESPLKHSGFLLLSSIYHELKLDQF